MTIWNIANNKDIERLGVIVALMMGEPVKKFSTNKANPSCYFDLHLKLHRASSRVSFMSLPQTATAFSYLFDSKIDS